MDNRNSNPFHLKPDVLDAHLSDELLLLATDGELPARDAAQVRLHLEACWMCRARVAQINDSIQQVVEYSNLLVQHTFPPSAQERTNFLANLRRLTEKGPTPSVSERITNALKSINGTWQRPVWISALGLACAAAIMLMIFRPPREVSADEIIHKSRESENALLNVVPRPVIYQQLHIETDGPAGRRAIDRAIYSDPRGARVVEAHNYPSTHAVVTAGNDPVQDALRDADLDWKDPLSIHSFERWQDSHRDRSDYVEVNDPERISIRSTILHGPVAELMFTFRASDFHPVAENISFRNSEQVLITEKFFEVFSVNVIDPEIFAVKSEPLPEKTLPPVAPKPLAPRIPSEKDLLITEMRARVALHAVKADLGDQIELQRQGGLNGLTVEGVVSSNDRRVQIESEMQGIPDLQMHLTVPDQNNEAPPPQDRALPDTAVVVEDQPLLQPQLKTKFPNAEARAAFVDATLEKAQLALAHAWAIKRLQERYSSQVIGNLDPPSRQTLELLLRDHVQALRGLVENEAALLQQLSPQFTQPCTQACTSVAKDWRSASKITFSALETLQHDALILLAGSQGVQDRDAQLQEMTQALQALKVQMPAMCELVNGNFLEMKEAAPLGVTGEQQ
jgi:hypothetical protein